MQELQLLSIIAAKPVSARVLRRDSRRYLELPDEHTRLHFDTNDKYHCRASRAGALHSVAAWQSSQTMMRSRRGALPTQRTAQPQTRRKRRRGTVLLVLCCYAVDAACLALGYALDDWRLVGGGVVGVLVNRARGGRALALLAHAGLAVALAARLSLPEAAPAHAVPPPPHGTPHVTGRALGLDDDAAVGWPADLVDFDAAQIRERHPALAADMEEARAHASTTTGSFCYTLDNAFSCVPRAYLLGAPKAGTSDLWRLITQHPSATAARRKETRFFTRGEFGAPREGYVDAHTRLDEFARSHKDTALRVRAGEDLTVLDGGPHTLWWSTARHDGVDSRMVPAPQLLRFLVPEAKLIVSLAEPARRTYSDYWFLTEHGVAGRPAKGKVEPLQSADDFHAKILKDVKALELCFDAHEGSTNIQPRFEWSLGAVQRCAYDRAHFGRNGRGRLGASVYAAFVGRWLDAFPREQLLVLRLEDRSDDDGLRRELGRVYAHLGLDAAVARALDDTVVEARANGAKAARPAMRADTAAVLHAFFRPLNARLASVLEDEKFLWKDAKPGAGTEVRAEAVAQHKLADRATRKTPDPGPPGRPQPMAKGSLMALVAEGDVDGVEDFFAEKRQVENAGDVLSVAALTLDEPVLTILLENGLDANATEGLHRTGSGTSPLHVACQTMCWADSMKHSFVFALLSCTPHPLDAAIERGASRLGKRILREKGAGTTYGQLHIRQALGGAATRVVQLLLKHGGDPNQRDALARTPAHYCAAAGFGDALEALARSGADLDVRDAPHAATPLHVAALHGQARAVVALLERGADASITDGHGHDLAALAGGRAAPLRAALPLVFEDDAPGVQVTDATEADAPEVLRRRLSRLLGGLLRTDPEDIIGDDDSASMDAPPASADEAPDAAGERGRGGWGRASRAELSELLFGKGTKPKSDPALNKAYRQCDFEVLDKDVSSAKILDRLTQNRPFVIRGLLDESWALDAMTRSKLLEAHGKATVTVSAIPYATKFSAHAEGEVQRDMELRTYVDKMATRATSPEDERYPWYVFRGHPVAKLPSKNRIASTESWFVDPHQCPTPPALYSAFEAATAFDAHPHKPAIGHQPRDFAARWEESEATVPEDPYDRAWPFVNLQWALGGPASGAPQHFHNTAWNACVYGAKRWLVYPPAFSLMSNEQIRKWDEHDRVKAEADGQPAPFTCVQRAGDIAVIPEMWGHGVVNLEETLAVATEVRMALYRPPLTRAFRQVAAVMRRNAKPKEAPRGHHGGEERQPVPPGRPRRPRHHIS